MDDEIVKQELTNKAQQAYDELAARTIVKVFLIVFATIGISAWSPMCRCDVDEDHESEECRDDSSR